MQTEIQSTFRCSGAMFSDMFIMLKVSRQKWWIYRFIHPVLCLVGRSSVPRLVRSFVSSFSRSFTSLIVCLVVNITFLHLFKTPL